MSTPIPLVTNREQLAAAHGCGVDVAHSPDYVFIEKGQTFIKYHKHPSILSSSTGKRFIFYQNNHLFWLKQGVTRPTPGEEQNIDEKYHCLLTEISTIQSGKTSHTFQTKAGQTVEQDRAFTFIIHRGTGQEDTIDFEAENIDERDKWVSTLNHLVRTAKQSLAEKQIAIRLVHVDITVKESGEVVITIVPEQQNATKGGETQNTTTAENANNTTSTPAIAAISDSSSTSSSDSSAPRPGSTTIHLDQPAVTQSASTASSGSSAPESTATTAGKSSATETTTASTINTSALLTQTVV